MRGASFSWAPNGSAVPPRAQSSGSPSRDAIHTFVPRVAGPTLYEDGFGAVGSGVHSVPVERGVRAAGAPLYRTGAGFLAPRCQWAQLGPN